MYTAFKICISLIISILLYVSIMFISGFIIQLLALGGELYQTVSILLPRIILMISIIVIEKKRKVSMGKWDIFLIIIFFLPPLSLIYTPFVLLRKNAQI